MNYRPSDLERICRQLTINIEDRLLRAGIFFRIFHRCKSAHSLENKLNSVNPDGSAKYTAGGKLVQDVIGIRINLYFVDDLIMITDHLKEQLKSLFVEETIDVHNKTEFKPQRINIIFKIAGDLQQEFRHLVSDGRVDATFELQLRTILSEGWHEVEHDLRYKCQQDWEAYPEMSRIFNGFLASLETQEWSMVHFFDKFSYGQYKIENLSASIRSKLRIRFANTQLGIDLANILESNEEFPRSFFKLEREKIVKFLLRLPIDVPLTIENVIYIINYQFIKDSAITAYTPSAILDLFEEIER